MTDIAFHRPSGRDTTVVNDPSPLPKRRSYIVTTPFAPRDPYTHYFTGLLASQLQQQDKAIAAFTETGKELGVLS